MKTMYGVDGSAFNPDLIHCFQRINLSFLLKPGINTTPTFYLSQDIFLATQEGYLNFLDI